LAGAALCCAQLAITNPGWSSDQAGETQNRRTVVVLGDSLAAGYGLDLSEAFPALLQKKADAAGLKFSVVNAGLSGDTSAGGLRRIDWLLKRRVDVLVATGGNASALAAKHATATIPIVFVAGDPVRHGLVQSINRPGGNVTGSVIPTTDMDQKRLSLLHELVPTAPLIGALLNPSSPGQENQLPEIEHAARTIGRRLFVAKASNDDELNAAFALLLQQGIGALLVAADPYFDTRRDHIIAFATQNRLPNVYHFRDYAFAGGLVSYGPSITDGYRQAGNYTGRILKGEKPADLPVLQPTKFDFVINLKTAKTLGLTVPFGLLNAADEVIE